MNNPSEHFSDRCRVCSFVFINIKTKRNLNGEFLKIFEEVFNQKVLPDDGLPHTVCDTCRYRIETSWKRNCKLKSSAVIPAEASLKRIYPLSLLTSSQEDEQTASNFNKEKGFRIPFENLPIRPKPPSLVVSDTNCNKEASVKISRGQSTQTRKSNCCCFPVSTK